MLVQARVNEAFGRNDIVDGAGCYCWPDGSVYEGEWRGGRRHGRGVMRGPDGGTYAGEWADGRKHGDGKYKWASGAEYEGRFKEGMKEGLGVYRWCVTIFFLSTAPPSLPVRCTSPPHLSPSPLPLTSPPPCLCAAPAPQADGRAVRGRVAGRPAPRAGALPGRGRHDVDGLVAARQVRRPGRHAPRRRTQVRTLFPLGPSSSPRRSRTAICLLLRPPHDFFCV
jgi:hypothetical protein